jgi:hypothetical protein
MILATFGVRVERVPMASGEEVAVLRIELLHSYPAIFDALGIELPAIWPRWGTDGNDRRRRAIHAAALSPSVSYPMAR